MDISIRYGTVVICGPTSTGKSTLSERILKEIPWKECKLISHDQVLNDIVKPHMSQVEINTIFRNTCFELLLDAIEKDFPIIYDGKYCEKERLLAFLMVQSKLNPDRQISLVKMATKPSFQQKYIRKRSGAKPTDFDVHMQNNLFRGVLTTPYSEIFPNLCEYTVTNPEEIVLNFLE